MDTINDRKEGSNKKISFKSVGWYFTIGNYFASSIKQKRIFQSAFEEILSAHEGIAESLFAGESLVVDNQKALNANLPRPPVSDEMRKIILDLNQCHLFDNSSDDTIKEEPSKPDKQHSERNRPRSYSKRPRWNSIVGAKVLGPQRFLNSFSIELASRREQLAKEQEAKQRAVKERLTKELELPKISKTTEDLIVRRSNLDDKLRIMKICHQNGLQYKEPFVRTTRRSYPNTPLSSSRPTRQGELESQTLPKRRLMKRSKSWHPASSSSNNELTVMID